MAILSLCGVRPLTGLVSPGSKTGRLSRGCCTEQGQREEKDSKYWASSPPPHPRILVQFSWVAQSCPTLCNPMNRSTPGLPVRHQLSEFKLPSIESAMPSNHLICCRPLFLVPSNFPSIRDFSNESALCTRWPKYCSSASASVLPMNIQDWFPLGWTSWISLQSKGLSRVFSNATVQKHQFFSTQLSL